ncbi:MULTISPECIES: activator-dependent family glycosyltransferase [Streptomyces]|uniref:activator-dependent family glycosyltransferase n=1 Tax=Streptomyces TaxID=1883 RepID=UPI000A3CFF76|nr:MULTISPECIES: activator-dependent family glycosyltransferase [Streptomyces]MDX3588332.1 activator-dependent family glycosyltransferase [Streptomyces europaeiscabiei]
MKVMFTCLPEKSHIYGMAPLAWALTAAGHEVMMPNSPGFTDLITGTGLVAAPVGRDHTMHPRLAAARETQDSELTNWSRLAQGETDLATLRECYELSVPYGYALFNDPVMDELVALAQSWRPDVVVRDPLSYAGAMAARAAGALHLRMLWCADVFGIARSRYVRLMAELPESERVDPLADWMNERGRPYGIVSDEQLLQGDYTLDLLPPSLRPATPLPQLTLRYQPYNGAAVLWDWLREPPKRPRVCLTLGNMNTEAYAGDYISIPTILDALSDLDIEVVVTVLPQQKAELGPVPANAVVVDDVALHTLLPSCSAVIHHGGWGTFSTALTYAVPQLILSTYIADQELRGRTLEREGAGFFVHHSEITAGQVREQLLRLLQDPSHRAEALRLSEEVATMPTAYDTVAVLEKLVAERAQRPSGT